MTDKLDSQLIDSVRELGKTLGNTISDQLGAQWLERIESIRKDGRKSYQGDDEATKRLKSTFTDLPTEDLLTVARAFSQFLNLANIAEQEFNSHDLEVDPVSQILATFSEQNVSKEKLLKALEQLKIDLVLTAHPTEVTRRTLIHKHGQLTACIAKQKHAPQNDLHKVQMQNRVTDLVSQAWHTEEIRSARPTPVDEARWGFSVIEHSLWQAVPDFIRQLDYKLEKAFDINLPLTSQPVQFSSWMGGDRDGNPFVTSKVSQEVLLRARYRAANLFEKDIERLRIELSMADCNGELSDKVGQSLEPYRALLKPLLTQLQNVKESIADTLNQGLAFPTTQDWLLTQDDLLTPLMLCHQSLLDCGMQITANGLLLDTLRRVHCFGPTLLKLDIRQDSERHADVLSEVTRYYGLGDYSQWSEDDKQAFLLRELASKRPLLPKCWQPSADVQEVLDTCKVIAQNPQEAFGIYIISMASSVSDVLCVQLLLQESGVSWPMPVAPLFETLDDLNNASDVIEKLLTIDWYRGYIKGQQYVMIGYSDSAKDAGALAAGWAQYHSQESLVAVAEKFETKLTLFHGRGGTIGRGGLPARAAIHSQPPGSLAGGFRVTEQGETIRYKFGMPDLANKSLSLYASAILEAIILPPPAVKTEWREAMSNMAALGRDNYRHVVRKDPEFVPYFRVATPEQELGKLPLGSRPAKRKPTGGIESLRAIPWIFAWAQTRMVLPSWLGVMPAVKSFIDNGNSNVVKEMLAQWPFFHSRLSMLDMVFQKADPRISQAYDERLVPQELKHFGVQLRDELKQSIELLLSLLEQSSVMESDPKGRESMHIRAGYLQPIHYLQIELLSRLRASGGEDEATLEKAMMVTIAGIAVGMRNTG